MSEKRYLITQSLLSAWLYQYNCAEGQEEDARQEFLAKLNREDTEQSEAMLRGISFEDAVYALLQGDNGEKAWEHAKRWGKRGCVEKEYECIINVANIMRGGTYQLTAYKDKVIDGEKFLLMAKCDWVRAGTILDCKRVETYANVGKYFDSVQHAMYLEVISSARAFRYVICDGADIYDECYTRSDLPETIEQIISQFAKALKAEGLWETYAEKWRSKY